MDRNQQYLQVVQEFVTIAGGQSDAVSLDTEISYEHDGMLAHLSMHPRLDHVVIDIEIMQLTEPTAEPRNLERMTLLHKLNGVTRFTHGAAAFISLDNMLVITRTIPLAEQSGQTLAGAVAELLQHAASLRAAWDELRQLISQTIQADAGQSTAGARLTVQQFA